MSNEQKTIEQMTPDERVAYRTDLIAQRQAIINEITDACTRQVTIDDQLAILTAHERRLLRQKGA